MITALKQYIKYVLLYVLYFGGIAAMIATIFKKVKWGLFILIFLIPQPNIWYKLHTLPFGKDFLDLFFISIIFGMIYQRIGFKKTNNTIIIIGFILYIYISLWPSSFNFDLALPISTSNPLLIEWKNQFQMIFMYFLVVNILKNEKEQKELIYLMAFVIFFISLRNYRNFTGGDVFNYDKRAGGPFEFVGLGANHFGAFIAYTWSFFFGLLFYTDNKKEKYYYLIVVILALHPIFFAYSRGVYLAVCGVSLFFGIFKKRGILLGLILLVIFWQTILPSSVVDRITMTRTESGELEDSAGERLVLWSSAIEMFENSPIFGNGFDAFRLYLTQKGNNLTDTHNYYLKVLCEQGIFGLCLLILIFIKAFISGFKLIVKSTLKLHKGIGYGFCGSVIAMIFCNIFGDRFSYFSLGSYFWIFWGLTDRCLINIMKSSENE